MDIYIAYGATAYLMILITLLFCIYRNWIGLRKNQIFFKILNIAVVTIQLDVMLVCVAWIFPAAAHIVQEIAGICMYSGTLFLFYQFLVYDLAVAGKMYWTDNVWFRFLQGCIAAAVLLAVSAPFTGNALVSYHPEKGIYYAEHDQVQVAVLAVCLISGMFAVFRERKRLSREEFHILTAVHLLLFADLVLQKAIEVKYAVSYGGISIMIVLYYLLLHNEAQYKLSASGCFSRAGFIEIMKERAHYRENFTCLGVCINNIESITNYCTEEEIIRIHQKLGNILKDVCGRHNVYQIHSFEYLVVARGAKAMVKRHELLSKAIPPYVRINNKNIPVLCSFFALEFADSDYCIDDFIRILTSMRKMAMEEMSREILLRYEGDRKQRIQREIEALWIVNEGIRNRDFEFRCIPIQSLKDSLDISCEVILLEQREADRVVSQEDIWEMAAEMGYGREIACIACEIACQFARREQLSQKGFKRIHINVASSQLSGAGSAKRLVEIMRRYRVPGENICMEVTVEQNTDCEKMGEAFAVLHEFGVWLLLDQFGVTVCSLKEILNMPFDAVKINHHMVRNYCNGNNRQLVHLVKMLQRQKWEIYLDGVDQEEQLEIINNLGVSYFQGALLSSRLLEEKEMSQYLETGGAFVVE